MGRNERCSWDDHKREKNIANHGYDFADVSEIFDGRFCVTRLDSRKDYGEARNNMLVMSVAHDMSGLGSTRSVR